LYLYFCKDYRGSIAVSQAFFEAPRKPQPTVRVKETKQQFDNVQDADFEDITDKK